MESFDEILINNKQLLEKAIKLDNSKWGLEKEFQDLFTETKKVTIEESKSYLVIYEGDIEYTKLICEKAIKEKANIVFSINDDYLATNELIVRISNEIIKEQDYKTVIRLYNNIDNNKVLESSKEFDEVKFIGSAFDYRNIKNKIHCKCEFIEVENFSV